MPEPEFVFLSLVLGSFLAALCSAAFSAGGALIILAITTTVLPITAIAPIHSTLLIGSSLSRTVLFREYIDWRIVRPFLLGSFFGAMLGARIFVELPAELIATAIAVLMLVAIWLPEVRWRPRLRHPWLAVGFAHALLSTLFAYGALFQSVVLHTRLERRQVIGTMAGCLVGMSAFKITGYAINGFDYSPYYRVIGACVLASVLGSWVGKRVADRVSERLFRTAYRLLVTLTALRLIWVGLLA